MLEGVTQGGNVWHVGFHKCESIFPANSEDDAFTFYGNQHAINSYIHWLYWFPKGAKYG